jgi:non-heme chloroperoxidase
MHNKLQKTVTLRTGLEISYVEQGDRIGVPLVLLHGYTDSFHSFDRLLAKLPTWVRAFALSQRGHGDSSKPASGYGLRDLALDVVDFLDALALRRAVLAGHSMGGLVAQRVAMDHPERTAGLVLVSTFPTYAGNPELEELWRESVSGLTDPIDPAFVRAFQESTIATPSAVPEAFVDLVVRESLKVPARVWRELLGAHLREDYTRELGRIDTPTLILHGDADGLARTSDQEVLARGIAGAELIVLRGAGHALPWERPAEVARSVVDHDVLADILRAPNSSKRLERRPA